MRRGQLEYLILLGACALSRAVSTGRAVIRALRHGRPICAKDPHRLLARIRTPAQECPAYTPALARAAATAPRCHRRICPANARRGGVGEEHPTNTSLTYTDTFQRRGPYKELPLHRRSASRGLHFDESLQLAKDTKADIRAPTNGARIWCPLRCRLTSLNSPAWEFVSVLLITPSIARPASPP